jgi:hypothetical protein
MLRNKFVYLFLFIFNLMFSQSKTDTIYVYEEIIIHDTIFIEKKLEEIKIDKAILLKEKANDKISLQIVQNGIKSNIKIDTIIGINKKQIGNFIKKKSWFFGAKLHFGLADNSFFKKQNAPNNLGIGLGIWTKKRLYESNFFIGTGLDGFYWSSPFLLDATQNESTLNGIYFVNDTEPILFKSLKSKHFQVQIPLQFYYNIKKFTPSIGVFASISNYKAEFASSSGTLKRSLDIPQTFQTQTLQIGYLTQLQYEISKHISIALTFRAAKSKNLIFVNKNDKNQSLKINDSVEENSILLSFIYCLKK